MLVEEPKIVEKINEVKNHSDEEEDEIRPKKKNNMEIEKEEPKADEKKEEQIDESSFSINKAYKRSQIKKEKLAQSLNELDFHQLSRNIQSPTNSERSVKLIKGIEITPEMKKMFKLDKLNTGKKGTPTKNRYNLRSRKKKQKEEKNLPLGQSKINTEGNIEKVANKIHEGVKQWEKDNKKKKK